MEKKQTAADRNKIWKLFTTMLYISSFTFGGGFVIVTLMKKKFADAYGWISQEEILDITAIAQSSPGPIAVNAAILVGKRVAGWRGAVAAAIGTVLPPMIVIGVLFSCYDWFKESRGVKLALAGMRAGVAAVILDVVFSLGRKVFTGKLFPLVVFLLALLANAVLRINVMFIVLAAVLAGVGRAFYLNRKGEDKP